MHSKEEKLAAFGRMLDVLDILRVKCPWDAKQTNESLRPNTIEETFELAEALSAGDTDNIRKELGDVLLHIAFYSKIGSEKGQFDIADVCNSLTDKLIFRHPHVFGDVKVDNTDQVLENWEQIKLREKGGNKTVLGGVPKALPALIKANRIQEKVRNVGFDWEQPAQVWDKVAEEIAEVKAEIERDDKDAIEAEFGDLLFAVVNAARLYGVNPENALERTNRKFIDRFNYLEQACKERGLDLKSMSLAEMDLIWEEAKEKLRKK
ncbi:MAG: nucleoside triphosphate pyrophosphohydrolase [Muribaculaceae bacterium]|nr:nucleoside triphosphate pyrophosphohydrolase [Muribaculaceae bacterium]MDE5957447.1 nucleoside triphosphate pyrophosphohydrolase [Muribaculaceae bacterium]MDE7343394.1 nucleoside triphosphate pyrophosphohydrolase [Muribaculaceae bacterium]